MNLRNPNNFKSKYGSTVMKNNVLPTFIDIGKHYNYILTKKKQSIKEVGDEICKIWNSASLPFISRLNVHQKVRRYIEVIENLCKYINKTTFDMKLAEHIQKYDILFDICSCKCINMDNCKCAKDSKVPTKERDFIIDQRSNRRMVILNLCRTEQTPKQSRIANIANDGPSNNS